jgi:hypothetical protein
MKPPLSLNLFVAAAVMAPAWALCARAEEDQSSRPSTAAATAADTNSSKPLTPAVVAPKARRQERLAAAALSPGVAELVKMVDAGVSTDLIKTYIANAPIAYEPKGADLIALKQHGAPDDIAAALLKKSSEAREKAAQARSSAMARVLAAGNLRRFSPDPESYAYFQQYYLFPRTLASAYERLGYYGAPNSYGSYAPPGAAPYAPFGYGYPGRF